MCSQEKKTDTQNITKVEKENITQKIPNFGLAIIIGCNYLGKKGLE